MNGTFIPRYLDSLPQIFWWEIDELAVLFVCIFLGIADEVPDLPDSGGDREHVDFVENEEREMRDSSFHWAYWSGVPTFS
ncbi:MAG: hypothetical protein IPL14_20815 [Nitrospira sp.]|nr:hypothetical protein [Nitrospira sp.]